MVVVYESKTGFTKKYADMLAKKTGFKAFSTNELGNVDKNEEIIFFGWLRVGSIKGLNKARAYNVRAVCCTGNGRTAEPDEETVISRNKIDGIPFFYLRGGCLPISELKGMDKFLLSLFVKALKKRKDKDEKTEEAITIIENGFDDVKEENLAPVMDWLNTRG